MNIGPSNGAVACLLTLFEGAAHSIACHKRAQHRPSQEEDSLDHARDDARERRASHRVLREQRPHDLDLV